VSELVITNNYTAEDLRQIADDAEKTNDITINSLQKYFDEYTKPIEQIATGFTILDRMLGGGIIRGTVGTIGARPSVGKTTYAVNIAAHNPEIKICFSVWKCRAE
jgi:Replicative DNA helicase